MKTKILSTILLCLGVITANAYNDFQLRANNFWGWGSEGIVSNVTYDICQEGLFAKVENTFTIEMAEDYTGNPNDSLEYVMNFELPKGAEMVDMHLWIYGIPEQALHLERRTATAIYNNIVQIRIDPALLTRRSETQYNIRVWPITYNMPRKVKLTYLVPLTQSGGKQQLELPFFLGNMGNGIREVNDLSINICDKDYSAVSVSGAATGSLALNNGQWSYDNTSPGNGTLLLSLTPKTQKNIRVWTYQDEENAQLKYFELEILPEAFTDSLNHRKVLFLIDYVKDYTYYTEDELIAELKNSIKKNLNSDDQFQLFVGGVATQKLSNAWLNATHHNIDSIVNKIKGSTQSQNYTVNLTIDGIHLANSTNDISGIILIGCGDKFGHTNSANPTAESILKQRTGDYPIQTISVQNYSGQYNNVGGVYTRGNEYLYNRLSGSTHGDFSPARQESKFSESGDIAFSACNKTYQAFSVNTILSTGTTFDIYNIGQEGSVQYYETPYRIIGKLIGDFPMDVKITQIYEGGTIESKTLNIKANDVGTIGRSGKQVWTGRKIRDYYAETQNSAIVNKIINLSLESRVLSYRTAFLALEPMDQNQREEIEENANENNNNNNVSTKPVEIQTTNIFPNPANGIFTIQSKEAITNGLLEIRDISGKLVLSQSINIAQNGNQSINISKLEAGTYFVKITKSDGKTEIQKLIVK